MAPTRKCARWPVISGIRGYAFMELPKDAKKSSNLGLFDSIYCLVKAFPVNRTSPSPRNDLSYVVHEE